MTFTKFVNNIASRETTWTEQIEISLILGLIGSSLVPIKYVVTGQTENILGFQSDFTSITLYLSLFFAVSYIFLGLYRNLSRGEFAKAIRVLLIPIFVGIIYHVVNPGLNSLLLTYSVLKITCALLVGYYVYKSEIWLKYKGLILCIISSFAGLNALLAILQFSFQQSLGLNLLGESPLRLDGQDIAKIVTHGTNYIRGYGLFPHPNVLSGILAIISLLNLYLLHKTTQIPRFFLWVSFCLISAGLFTTLSRAGLFAFGLGFLTWWLLWLKSQIRINKMVLFGSLIWIGLLSAFFFPWLVQRATWSDQAVVERQLFNTASIAIIQTHWLLGTGPGSNLLVLHEKLSAQLADWQIQPVHNYFLISLADLGVVGLIICIVILYIFYKIFRKTLKTSEGFKHNQAWLISLSAISIIIFTLFWFDHYFYTIWPTQLLLWIFIGLMVKEIKIPKPEAE